jgi:hypothetical protein
VGVLASVIQVLRGSVLHRGHHQAVRSPVTAQLIGNDHPWHVPQPLQQLTKEPGGGLGVPTGGDQDVQDIPKPIYTAPNPDAALVALDELEERWDKKYAQ